MEHKCENMASCEICQAHPIFLHRMKVGQSGIITGLAEGMQGRKKFTDVGLVEGGVVRLDGRAPFGGLLRITILNACLAIHSDDAKFIKVKVISE